MNTNNNLATPSHKIYFSYSAIQKAKALIKDEDCSALKLRIAVHGGGCSGFTYAFTFDEIVEDDDIIFLQDGVDFVVDCMSYPFLVDAQIDYVDDPLNGSQFTIKNPNAVTTCGCGSSFSI